MAPSPPPSNGSSKRPKSPSADGSPTSHSGKRAKPSSPVTVANPKKASYGLSGLLSNDVSAVESRSSRLSYAPPKDRIMPTVKYRMYVYKDSKEVEVLYLHRKDYYVFGRGEHCDVKVTHGSVSSEHAALQYRQVDYSGKKAEYKGMKVCKPYLISLNSTNGTSLNGDKLEEGRYVEMRDGDVIKLGESTREYVFMRERL